MGKQEAGDGHRFREGRRRLRGFSTRFDHTLSRWCADDTRFEKPLRTVFLSILGLTVAVLTLQNVASEFRSLSEPQDVIVQTAERLLMQQRAFGAETLDRVARTISADKELQAAIRDQDRGKVRQIADKVFAKDHHGLEIAEFTIYGADRNIVYRAQGPGISAAPDASLQSDLNANPLRKSNGIELRPDHQIVVGVLRSWVSDGQMLGYLKLSINIEHTLALAGSAVNAQIVKVHKSGGSDAGAGAVRYKALGGPGPETLNVAEIAGPGGLDGLNGFHLHAGRVFVVHDLPIPITGTDGNVKLVLVKDATSNVWTFLERTLFALLAGIALALLSWTVIHRLLSRLQTSVRMTRDRLEAEVRETPGSSNAVPFS
ncbi:hypothetical protein ACFQEX_07390 [Roseibium salinum]|uniref:hypothetical protein n=1 Tax=Roseibium salinum TaxID=1604349 RepID=UPI0036135275